MAFDKYSWDDDSGSQQDDPWGSLRPSYVPPDTAAPQRETPSASTAPRAPVAPSPYNPQTGAYGTPGMGSPESGYGPGGVNNPAYTGIGSPNYVAPGAPPPATAPPPRQPGGAGVDGNFFLSLVQGKPPSPQTLHAMESELAQHGIQILRNARGWADKIRLPNGQVYDVIQAATQFGGKAWQLLDDSGGAATDRTARGLMASLSADGHDVQAVGFDQLMVDGRPYRIKPAPAQPNWQPTFAPGEQLYTPGEITMDDLEGLGYQDVAGRLQTPVSQATDDLVLSLVQNPEALSDQMVDTLKAKRAEELAGIATAQEEDLLRFGFANNLGDSRWLASERLAGQRDRDRALLSSNQEIDILAAQTRMEDRRAAAQIGLTHSQEQRAREALATDTGLRQAALTGDRLALRESIAQKAAELEIDQNQLVQSWTVALMEDMTRRWGIEAQFDVDMARLAQQSAQFQEDLFFKMMQLDQQMALGYAQLEQDDRQFGADYGLRVAELEERRSRVGG